MTPDYEAAWKPDYADRRRRARDIRNGILYVLNDQSALDATPDERRRVYEERWQAGGFPFMAAFNDLIANKDANDTAADFVRAKIRAVVKDPAVAESLIPTDYPIGAKRLCLDTEYFETYNRDNVTLVDLRKDPIERFMSDGTRTRTGTYALDSLVLATGFDAMTGTLLHIDIRGRSGITLAEKWADGPRSYLGLAIAGLPNLWMVTGPGSPSVLSNMMVSIEQHVNWITDCLVWLRRHDIACIEAEAVAEADWVAHVEEVGNRTVYPLAKSWYMGANIPGKPRVFMPYIGGVPVYRQKCDEVAARGYEGFTLSPQRLAAAQ
jgi:cyclohexanone monooxygenase